MSVCLALEIDLFWHFNEVICDSDIFHPAHDSLHMLILTL